MITLDQVLLLQKKVETAVVKIRELNSKISQLEAENAALLKEKAELSKALSDKTGLVSSLEAEQNKIEDTILHALEQLNAVETSIMDSSAPAAQDTGILNIKEQPSASDSGLNVQVQDPAQIQPEVSLQDTSTAVQALVSNGQQAPAAEQTIEPSIHFEADQTGSPTPEAAQADTNQSDANQFDIF